MEHLHIDDTTANTTQSVAGGRPSFTPNGTIQATPGAVLRSMRPNASTPYLGVVDPDNILVTSPTSYQDQQQQQQRQPRQVPLRIPPRISGADGNIKNDSFQYHYNPLSFTGGAGTFPPLSASATSALSSSSPSSLTSTSRSGTPTQHLQAPGLSSYNQGGLSRAKSLAVTSSAARQGLLQQQQYQQQRLEQYMRMTQNDPQTPGTQPIPLDAWAKATGSVLGMGAVSPAALESEPGWYPSGTTIPSPSGSSSPSLGLTPPPLAPRPVTPKSSYSVPNATVVIDEQPGKQTNGVPPHSTESSLEPANATLQGRASTIQFGESPGSGRNSRNGSPSLPHPYSHSTAPLQRQQQLRQGTPSSPDGSPQPQPRPISSSYSASASTPLARAGTISTAGGNAAALNAQFISHYVPKTLPKNSIGAIAAAAAAAASITSPSETESPTMTPESSHIEVGPGPVVLVAIGKTGQGKIMGTNELKASASVRAVTKGIAERSGWVRFEDNRRFLATLADTPGLADTEGDDEKNIPILQEYISSIGSRLGVTAFLLVFKINSSVDIIMTILKKFKEIMQEFPNVWDNVILVFTGCDFKRDREIMEPKQLMTTILQDQIREHILNDIPSSRPSHSSQDRPALTPYSLSTASTTSSITSTTTSTASVRSNTTIIQPSSSPFPTSKHRSSVSSIDPTDILTPVVPMVFLTTAENICSFALGSGRCDCDEHSHHLKMAMKRLWNEIRKMKRWVIHNENDEDEFIGHS
ncbi:hypothetical protein EDD11_002160 [Mortierella claussenii]|nr:hypothetical protein EDD11_002160 [Mortierella claussenii]